MGQIRKQVMGVMALDGQQRLISVWSLEIAGGEIRGIGSVVNPDACAPRSGRGLRIARRRASPAPRHAHRSTNPS